MIFSPLAQKQAKASAKWIASDMDNRLSEIWVKHLSTATLSEWRRHIGGQIEELTKKYLLVCTRAICEVTSRTERSSRMAAFTIACRLGDELLPRYLSADAMVRAGLACCEEMTVDDLQVLHVFYGEELGKRIVRGERRRERQVLELMGKISADVNP